MKKTNETDSLNELIKLHREKQEYELKVLKDQFHVAYESLKPINMLETLVHQVTASPNIKKDLSSSAIGLFAGFLSKKIFGDYSHKPVKRIVGTAAQLAIGNLVAKHADSIINVASNVVGHFFSKPKSKYSA